MSKENPNLRTWRVTDIRGNVETINAHYMFQCEHTGTLSFRYKTPQESYVAATYSPNGYASCILIKNGVVPAAAARPTKNSHVKPQRGFNPHLEDDIPF